MILKYVTRTVFVLTALTLPCMSWPLEHSKDSPDLDELLVCKFREKILPVEAFPLHTGNACVGYNDRRVFVGDRIPQAATCVLLVQGLNVTYPCYEGANGSLPFDPSDAEAFREISATFKKASDAERWRRCYQASLQCCDRIVTTYGAEQRRDPGRCPSLWDGWDCWQSAAEGTFESNYCKEYIYSADAAPSCHYPSRKHCFSREFTNTSMAMWNQTSDYTTCSTKSRLVFKYTFHVAMLGVSVALSLPAIFIFFCYRKLRVPRIALHRNLLIIIVLRSALMIWQIAALSFNSLEATDQPSVMDENGAACRLLSAAVQLFSNAVFALMLVEGVFLHRLIAAAFKSQLNMVYLYSAAAVLSVAPMIPWTVLRIVKYDYSCWATGASDLDWINNGVRVGLLLINCILMIDIIRVLLTKLRGVNSWHSDKIKRTARSTLFLLPLFGINTLFVADKPSVIASCDWENVFDMVTHIMEGMQGPCVALLYCYLNKEVQILLKKTYDDAFPRLAAARGRESRHPRRTFTTNVDEDAADGSPRPSGDAGGCVNPLASGAEVARASRVILDMTEEAKESSEHAPTEPGRDASTFKAWNRFQGEEGPSSEHPSQEVNAWNIFRREQGEGSSRNSAFSKRSNPDDNRGHRRDRRGSEDSSPAARRSRDHVVGQREDGSFVNSVPERSRSTPNVECQRDVSSA